MSLAQGISIKDMEVDMDSEVDAIWTTVDVEAEASRRSRPEEDDEEASSLVIISRSGSPAFKFHDVHTAATLPRIIWPPSLPWFQLRSALEDTVRTRLARFYLIQSSGNRASPMHLAKMGNLTIGSTSVSLVAGPQAVDAATKAISKTMPELFPGENRARLEIVAGGDKIEAKLQAFQLLCYQLSNKLIEDPDIDDENFEDFNKYEQSIKMFRDLDLPRDLWADIFVKQKTRTSSAFAETLFEAAINEKDLEIVTTLLESGIIDPDQPVWTVDGMQCPIQWAAQRIESPGHSDVLKLLVRLGADVNAWTDDFGNSALGDAATSGSLEIVRFLVENGADFRDVTYSKTGIVGMNTPLTNAVLNERGLVKQGDEGRSEPLQGNSTEDEEGEEAECVKIFRYLLSLHGEDGWDHAVIQDAFISSAEFGRTDLIPLALDVGADLDEPGSHGYTALQAAASRSYYDNSAMVKQLVGLGAKADTQMLSELHIAAMKATSGTLRALIEHGMDVNISTPGLTPKQVEYLSRVFILKERARFRKIAHLLRTPLDFALAQRPSHGRNDDQEINAVTLLHAGARLTGGELVRAIAFKSDELLRCILDRGADVNERWNGRTALQACLEVNEFEMAEKLIRAGARLEGGEVCAAFDKGSPEFIETLLAHGGTLDQKGDSTLSPLERACFKQNWPVVEWALERGLVEYSPGALCAAVCSTQFENEEARGHIRSLLHRRKQSLDRYNPMWSLLEATAAGHAVLCYNDGILEQLLPLGNLDTCVVPMRRTEDLIKLLSWERHWVIERYSELDWTKPGQVRVSILVPAILSRDWDNVKRLLANGYKPDPFALLATIHHFDNDEVTQLLAAGARADRRMLRDVQTPLQHAARRGLVDVCRTLLRHAADVNADAPRTKIDCSFPPRTALQAATETGDQELIGLLLEAGADVNGAPSPDHGATALQLAAIKGYLPIAQRLLEAGADIDAERARLAGRTALEGAAEHGRLDMVQFLLENGARTYDDGACQYHRAMGFARKHGHRSVLRLLEDWGEGEIDSFWGDWDGLLDDDFRQSDAEEYSE